MKVVTLLARERYKGQPMLWPSLSSYISLYCRRYVPSVSHFRIHSRSTNLFSKDFLNRSNSHIFKVTL